MQYRRFGRTNLNIPILSLGGMRFQKSWEQLDFSEISYDEQNKVENILNLANKYGLSHVETAKYYGTSEVQLGMGFKNIKKSNHLNRLVPLSPLTEMATNFHERNGAKLIQINETTQNFEYKVM